MLELFLLCCIVDNGKGSKVLRIAKNHGVKGGTVFMGVGTVRSRVLEFLALDDIRKEIVLMVVSRENGKAAIEALDHEMALHKPNHGIAFLVPVKSVAGVHNLGKYIEFEDRAVTDTVYNAIFTVVDKGQGESVVEAAKEAGARGATIIHARGSGIHETSMLFAMQIEPEKDMVLILAANDICSGIITSIREKLDIDEPGTGIIFSVGVSETYGLY